MSEMCSVCIIRAQRDDDDFLPCSTECFRAALDEAVYQGWWDMLGRCREAVAALPEYKMRDTCVSAIDKLREAKERA
jgi:hypothetical protein